MGCVSVALSTLDRVAGVKSVWVASPRPQPSVLAAAYIAGADGLLTVGGAQAIAAFAYGAGEVPICDAIVGPGNVFVTAAKSLVRRCFRCGVCSGQGSEMPRGVAVLRWRALWQLICLLVQASAWSLLMSMQMLK